MTPSAETRSWAALVGTPWGPLLLASPLGAAQLLLTQAPSPGGRGQVAGDLPPPSCLTTAASACAARNAAPGLLTIAGTPGPPAGRHALRFLTEDTSYSAKIPIPALKRPALPCSPRS